MRRSAFAMACLALMIPGPGGCDRRHEPERAARAEHPSPATTPPTPAQRMKMVCRSSRTGLAVDCGRSDAVMVGMKPA